MQGKEKNITKIDKQFKDRSWAEMQKILDVEMPQSFKGEKGKKRYLLLLLFLLFGFGSGVGTMFYFNQEEKISEPVPVDMNKKEIAKNDDAFENLEKSGDLSIAGDPQKAKNNQNLNHSTKDQFSVAVESKINYQKKNIIKNNPASPEIAENNSILFAEDSQAEQGQTKEPIENQSYIEQPDFEKDQVLAIDFINSKSSYLEDPLLDQNIEYLNTPKDKKWSFGLILGAYANDKKITAGLTFGGKATYNLDRRFTLGGGLQYSILTGYQEGSVFRKNAEEYASTSVNSIEPDTSSLTNIEVLDYLNNTLQSVSKNDDLPISSLHYIEMPIEVAYRFSEKFQLNLGFKAGYLVHTVSDGSIPNLTRRQINVSLTESINHFDFATSIGLGFYPTKKLGLDLRYNHGLVDITKDDNWAQNQVNPNRNIQLSVLYFFGKK